ncbi:MAG TPA: ABC transporter ATP-binding protein [Spirochaetota bacterium]|nr:ABC transporter ATP-binding protein [Spirochaetota bacterium]
MNEYIYQIKNLNFAFNKKSQLIIENANLSIKKSKLTAIVGVNGSGKSTFLKLLINFLSPLSGDIIFLNKNLKDIEQKNLSRHIAYVSQNPNENIPLTVDEVINFGNYPYENLIFRDKPHFKENLNNALKITRTEHLKDKLFTNLSIGEKQKVMIARAICQNTQVILLDEPTSSLDIKNEVEIMRMLKQFVIEKKISIILICHNLNLISQYADEIIFINDKKITYGTKEILFNENNLSNIFNTNIHEITIEDKKIFY